MSFSLAGPTQVEMFSSTKTARKPGRPCMLPRALKTKSCTTFRIGGTILMASDGCQEGSSFGLSLTAPRKLSLDRTFAALAEGGQVQMPLTKLVTTLFRHADRFGIGWIVSVVA